MDPSVFNLLNGNTAAAAPSTANAAAASVSTSIVNRVAAQTLQQNSPPTSSPLILINACLKKLQGLLTDSEIELLKHLPIEQIIDIALKKLLASMLEDLRQPNGVSENLFPLLGKFERWRSPEDFSALKDYFEWLTKETTSTQIWAKACNDYLPTLEILAKQKDSLGLVLKPSIDIKTKQEIRNFLAKVFLPVCNKIFLMAKAWFANRTDADLYDEVGLFSTKQQKVKSVNTKQEFIECLEHQITHFFNGSRWKNILDFLEKPFNETKLQQINNLKTDISQVCNQQLKLVGELRTQNFLTEKYAAFVSCHYFSEESRRFQEQFVTDIFIVYDRFYDSLITKCKSLESNPAWKGLDSEVAETARTNVLEIFQLLTKRWCEYFHKGRFNLILSADREKLEGMHRDAQKEISSTMEKLTKTFPEATVKIIKEISEEFYVQMEKFGHEVLTLEYQYSRVDKLLLAQVPASHRISVEIFDRMVRVIDETLDPYSVVKNIDRQSGETIPNLMCRIFNQMRSKGKGGNSVDFKTVLAGFKKSRFEVNFPRRDPEPFMKLGRGFRSICIKLDNFSASMRFVRDLYSQICSFNATEQDTKAQQFNQDETEWMSNYDEFENHEKESAAITKTVSSKPSKKKIKSKKSKNTATAAARPPSPPKDFVEYSYRVDHYSSLATQLIATHRHKLRQYYRVPDYIVTPLSLVEKAYTPAEVAIQQQIMSTDCLQWVVGMLEKSKNPKVRELLTTFYFLWFHLGAEQGLTRKILKNNSLSPLKHHIDTLCSEAGLKVTPELFQGHIWGTDYIRYPFTVPKPNGHPPLAFLHVRNPGSSTVNTLLSANLSLMREYVQIQDRLLKESDAGSPKSTPSTAAAEADKKNANAAQKSVSGSVSAASAATAAPPPSQTISDELAKTLAAQGESLRVAQNVLMSKMALISASHSKRVLQNVQFHVDNLRTLISLVTDQSEQENLFVEMSIAYLSAQYFCENLGHYLALEMGCDQRGHDLTFYTRVFGLGDHQGDVLQEIRKLNFEKGSEYLFRGNHYSDVAEGIQYLSGLFATSKYATLTQEGIKLPTASGTDLTKLHQEMVQKIKTLVALVVRLISIHFPTPD